MKTILDLSLSHLPGRALLFAAAMLPLLLLSRGTTLAGSATWNLNPATNDWNTAANWTPATVPNGLSDVATFDVSNKTSVSLSSSVTLNGIVFNPGASAFTITSASAFSTFLINGAGITNNSGIEQKFVTAAKGHDQGEIDFAATATAGNATYTNNGAVANGSFGGGTSFFNTSTADTGTFIANGGVVSGAAGGGILFFESSTAGSGNFTINGGSVSGATGGHVEFVNLSTADHATLIANGGLGGGAGGTIFFLDDSTGGKANVTVSGNGNLDISSHNAPGVMVGQLQGDGLVFLGSISLTVNNRSNITFAGVIADGGFGGGTGGALAKIGKGRLDLTNANTYTGGTTINGGTLLIDNSIGSGTGSGSVRVNVGTLGGRGTIAGAVMVGTGSGAGAILSPGRSESRPGVLTLLGTLTFDADASYRCGFNSNIASSDEVFASGVTINTGTQFFFADSGSATLTLGIVFTIISNTAATPIAGTFSNLPDGSTFTINGNTFQVSYEGGDGNDLTLTVVPST
jgi:autotransporter-associated beta strand protein